MFFNANRHSHRMVERGFEACKEVAASEALRRSLGSRATRICDMMDNFFVPNYRNGMVTIPQQYKESDAVAVLPVKKGEPLTVSLDFAHFSPSQRISAHGILASHLPPETSSSIQAIEWALKKGGKPVSTVLSVYATVTALSRELTIPREGAEPLVYQTFLRPLVLIDRTKDLPPSVMGHELTHVDQYSNQALELLPEEETTHRERREVEAYIDGAAWEQAEGLGYNYQQGFVDAGRRLASLDRPIQVTDAFRNYLKNNGYEAWDE